MIVLTLLFTSLDSGRNRLVRERVGEGNLKTHFVIFSLELKISAFVVGVFCNFAKLKNRI